MYNHATIVSCLRGLIGFQSSTKATHPAIDDDLQESTSGVVMDELHPLLTFENLLSVIEQKEETDVAIYSGTATYRMNAIVKQGGTIYQSVQNANSGHALNDAAWWRKTNLYSAWVRAKYDAAIRKLFDQLVLDKKLMETMRTLLSKVELFQGVGNIRGIIQKSNRFCGFKIRLKEPDVVAVLNYIGLQLDTVQNPVNIYLYHSSSNVYIKRFQFNHTASLQFKWHEVATKDILSYMDATVYAGGFYYIGYYESELTGNAIKKDIHFGSGWCASCTEQIVNSRLFTQWSKYVTIQPFYVPYASLPVDGGGAITKELWNEEMEILVDDHNFGLNLQMTVQCDIGDTICRTKNIYVAALGQQLVVDMLNEMKFSTRDNQRQLKIAGMAANALGDDTNPDGEVSKLKMALKGLSVDLSGISGVCSSCNNPAPFKQRSAWQ